MKHLLATALLPGLSLGTWAASAASTDISGTWEFLVHHADPELGETRETFVFKQAAEKLSGAYSGSLGEPNVTGTVKGDTAVFTVEANRLGQTFTLSFTGCGPWVHTEVWTSQFWCSYWGVRRMRASDLKTSALFPAARLRGADHRQPPYLHSIRVLTRFSTFSQRGSMAKPYQVKQVCSVLVRYELAEEGQ
jgi:hypothetical protein